jgi:hypothetical protein
VSCSHIYTIWSQIYAAGQHSRRLGTHLENDTSHEQQYAPPRPLALHPFTTLRRTGCLLILPLASRRILPQAQVVLHRPREHLEEQSRTVCGLPKALLCMELTHCVHLLVPYKKDRAFRRYASGVERALSLFDTAQQEWADYISFLGRLLKVYHSDT